MPGKPRSLFRPKPGFHTRIDLPRAYFKNAFFQHCTDTDDRPSRCAAAIGREAPTRPSRCSTRPRKSSSNWRTRSGPAGSYSNIPNARCRLHCPTSIREVLRPACESNLGKARRLPEKEIRHVEVAEYFERFVMKLDLGKACLCTLMLGLFGAAHAAGTSDGQSAPKAGTSVETGQANGRVSGQESTGGMQPSTPGGGADNSAGGTRPAAQGSSGGAQPVTPGGNDQGTKTKSAPD